MLVKVSTHLVPVASLKRATDQRFTPTAAHCHLAADYHHIPVMACVVADSLAGISPVGPILIKNDGEASAAFSSWLFWYELPWQLQKRAAEVLQNIQTTSN